MKPNRTLPDGRKLGGTDPASCHVRNRRPQGRRAVTFIELVVAVAILSLLTAVLLRVLSQSQRGAQQGLQSHLLHEQLRIAAALLADDVREANVLIDPGVSSRDHQPPLIELDGSPADAVQRAIIDGRLRMGNPENRLTLITCTPVPPTEVGRSARRFFRQARVTWNLEADPSEPRSYALIRTIEALDADGRPDPTTMRIKTLLDGIDRDREYVVFFRGLAPTAAQSARQVYLAARLLRREGGRLPEPTATAYDATVLMCARIRGTVPDVW